jgi:hypothetical protein
MSPEVAEERLALAYEREFLEHERRRRRAEYLAKWPLTSSGSKTGRWSSNRPNLQRLTRAGAAKDLALEKLAAHFMNSPSMKLFDFKSTAIHDEVIISTPPRSGKTMLMHHMLAFGTALDQMVYYDLESSYSGFYDRWVKRYNPLNVACEQYVSHHLCRTTSKRVGSCEQA